MSPAGGLNYLESFPGQVSSVPGFSFQVVNLGVQGYGTDQSLLQLEKHIKKFNISLLELLVISNNTSIKYLIIDIIALN